jgi:hypothetical protein
VALDGAWSEPGLTDAPNLTIVYFPESIGQRAATNQAARLSQAKYVMKIDAHCVVDEGFDVKMMEDMQDNYTMIPTLYNLHAFDWVCIGNNPRSGNNFERKEWFVSRKGCGHRIYQSPTPKKCPACKTGNMERELIFLPRLNRKSTHYRFDSTMHFKYWGSLGDLPQSREDISESLSAQGSCFMLTREKYWELNICDERHSKSGWGQQGTEVACATWLSGGKLMISRKTWYSHLFRTQGGDFSFPYPLSGTDQEASKAYSRDLWFNNKHEKQIYPLSWLLEKFWPIPDWTEEQLAEVKKKGEEFYKTHPRPTTTNQISNKVVEPTKGIIFYTDNLLKLKFAHKVQGQLKKIGLPITSASLKPMPHFGDNVHIPLERGLTAYFTQIITALERSKADIVYMCEHDVIYHPSHFDFIPDRKDLFYYNQNFWRIRPEVDNFAVHWDANQVSGLVCYRELVLDWYKKKWASIQQNGFDRSYEPGGRNSEEIVVWKSQYPNIDIRHGGTLTKSKWSLADFRDKSTSAGWEESTLEKIPGWDIEFLQSLR